MRNHFCITQNNADELEDFLFRNVSVNKKGFGSNLTSEIWVNVKSLN